MRYKAQAVIAAVVAIGIGPAELSFAGGDVARPAGEPASQVSGPTGEVATPAVAWAGFSVLRSRTEVRRSFTSHRTRIVREWDGLDRLDPVDRALATGTRLAVS